MYRFFGWECSCAPAAPANYPGIGCPRDLYDALLSLWSAETCAPRMREDWSYENPTLGQCSITAFLAQDIFGGIVRGIPLGDGNFHCYNVVGSQVFDLTSEQFGDRPLTCAPGPDNPEQFRTVHFAKKEKEARYLLLRSRLLAELERRKN